MVMKSQIDTFKPKCLLILFATIRELFDKIKLGSSIMCYTSSLNPSHPTNLASLSESLQLLIK